MVKHGADINAETVDGVSPLYMAVHYNFPSIVEYLVKQGADVSKENNNDESPIDIANENYDSEIDEYLSQQEDRIPIML